MTATAATFTRFAMFDQLSVDDVRRLVPIAREVIFAAGERIFQPDQAADACWLLETGRVAIDTPVPGHAPMVVQTLGPGDVLGWSWLVPPRRWHFGAIATEPVTALELDAERLRGLCADHPALGYLVTSRFMAALVDRLQHTRARLLDLYRNDGHVR